MRNFPAAYKINRANIVWQIYNGRLDWFYLDEGVYKALAPDANGIISSHVFPGLRLAVSALLEEDMTAVLQALQEKI
ncbi:MAG: hypothetical protein GWP17_02200 [Aquificales bacterium]|nr:hypothetical protein [Aquificales bacterium]